MKAIAVEPLCGNCVKRVAVREEVMDGRRTFMCLECSEGEIAEPEEIDERPRKRLITALRWNPGATFCELRFVLGVPAASEDKPMHDRYAAALVRLVALGTARRAGKQNETQYWLVGDQRRP